MKTVNFLTKTRWLVTIMLLALGVSFVSGATTYKLTSVTSVSAGNKYVLVEDGYALRGAVSSNALQTTNSYKTTGLSGSETYVWTLESATGGFYIKNCSTTLYIRNSSSTTITLPTNTGTPAGSTSNIVWSIAFSSSTATITCNGSSRYLGETSNNSHVFKAYSESGHANSFTVYVLETEASCSTNPTVTAGSLKGSFNWTYLFSPFLQHK